MGSLPSIQIMRMRHLNHLLKSKDPRQLIQTQSPLSNLKELKTLSKRLRSKLLLRLNQSKPPKRLNQSSQSKMKTINKKRIQQPSMKKFQKKSLNLPELQSKWRSKSNSSSQLSLTKLKTKTFLILEPLMNPTRNPPSIMNPASMPLQERQLKTLKLWWNSMRSTGKPFNFRIPFCLCHKSNEVPLHELDPRNYKFVPACWMNRIKPAGRETFKSEALYNVILGDPSY